MPYKAKQDLPTGVKNSLPQHAQDIYKEAYNSAWEEYDDLDKDEREQRAHRVAWSAVKKQYERDGGNKWHKK